MISDLIDIGLCCLHVVLRALLKGIRKVHGRWISYLNLFGWLFQYTYERRTTYKEMTESTVFPLQFFATRWDEDEAVATRANEIYPICI